MKKIKYVWHLFILIIVYFPYLALNEGLLVDIFGCGCPKIDENGNMLANQFNANDFSKLFWTFNALILIAISIFISLKIHDKKRKVAYLIGAIIMSFIIPYICFLATPVWR